MDIQIIPRINQERFSCSIDEHGENSFATAQIDQSKKWMTFDILLNGNTVKTVNSLQEAMDFRRQLVIDSTRVTFPDRNTKTLIF